MTQTSNRLFDEMARLMNDAAGVAQGVRREFDTLFRAQAERILRELEVVQREEFEAVKEMARLAREENEALKARVEALEGRLAEKGEKAGKKGKGGGGRIIRAEPFSTELKWQRARTFDCISGNSRATFLIWLDPIDWGIVQRRGAEKWSACGSQTLTTTGLIFLLRSQK